MSLKLDFSPKKVIKWVATAILVVLFAIFFVRVAVWEHEYYQEKEGSEREEIVSVSAVQEPEEELIEVEPTEEEVAEYTVPADHPRYLTIEKLRVYNARILAMRVNASGELKTPNNIFDVGWYESSGKPGSGKTLVIDGHNGGPHVHGVFKNLPDLGEGDVIVVERGDGVKYRYAVVENKTVPLSESNAYMSVAMRSPQAGRESVTLITCTGEWSQVQGTYLSRQFTRAILVD